MSCRPWRFTGNSCEKGKTHIRYRGSVSAETISVLFLLLILGIGIFALAVSSTSAYSGIYNMKNTDSQLRLALSFINMKIRQNDRKGAVRVGKNPVNGGSAVIIREEYDNGFYETWIYQNDGKLREALMPEGMEPSDEYSFEIADADGFAAELDRNLLNISVWIDNDEGTKRLDGSIKLRAD